MPYRIALLVLALGLTSLPNTTLAEEKGEPIPDTIYAWGDFLRFVALDRAVDSSGKIDADVLSHPSRAVHLRRKLDAKVGASGCVESNVWNSGDIPTLAGFESLSSSLLKADHVLIGRVLGLRVGYQGRFGHAVLIETEEPLVGAPEHRFYIFFPKGDFEFQGKRFCIDHYYYPDLPNVGDRILVMHQDQSSGPMISLVGGSGLIVLPEQGAPGFGKSDESNFPESDRDVVSLETSDEVISWAKESLRKAGKL